MSDDLVADVLGSVNGFAANAAEWDKLVTLVPARGVTAYRGVWVGRCSHPDHEWPWTTVSGTAGAVSAGLVAHWKAKHGG
jgi:hypothetical protein